MGYGASGVDHLVGRRALIRVCPVRVGDLGACAWPSVGSPRGLRVTSVIVAGVTDV